jgi:hypothetical protein
MGLTRLRAEQISDIDYKQAVRAISTTNVTLSGGAPSQVDGVNLSVDDRVLVNGQNTGNQNGIYQVETVGTGSNGTWIRSVDTNATGELQAGTIVMVTEGTVYKDTQWKLTTNNPIIIGTTALTFEQNSAFAFGNIYANGTAVLANTVGDVLTLTAGNNIQITGNNSAKSVTIAVTGISLNSISNGTSNVNVVSSGGNITVGVAGTNNVAVLSSDTATFAANLLPSANVTYSLGSNTARWKDLWVANSSIYIGDVTLATTGNSLTINGANVLTGNAGSNLSTTGNVVGGNILTSGVVSSTGTITGANITGSNLLTGGLITATGNITGGNILTTGTVSATGTITGAANITGGNLLTSGLITATGNVIAGNVSTAGLISATGNITGGNILGNGAGLSGITSFSNITVTGGNSAVADSIADTLTLTAGTGISIVIDPATDTITIGAQGGSELFVDGADFGTVTEPVTVSEDLGLITGTVDSEADLGELVISGLIYPDQFVLPGYTTSTLPSAAIAGAMIYVTNETGGPVPAFADGTNWRRVTDRAIVT